MQFTINYICNSFGYITVEEQNVFKDIWCDRYKKQSSLFPVWQWCKPQS